MTDAELRNLLAARDAFKAMIKAENSDLARWAKWPLSQHWMGAHEGFSNPTIQRRWQDFKAGWRASLGKSAP